MTEQISIIPSAASLFLASIVPTESAETLLSEHRAIVSQIEQLAGTLANSLDHKRNDKKRITIAEIDAAVDQLNAIGDLCKKVLV